MNDKEMNTTNPFVEKEEQNEAIKEENKEQIEEPKADSNKEATTNREEDLKKVIEDLNNKYLRMAADFDNYRKRQMQERENLIKYGAEETLKKIIPVLDTLDRARASIEKTEDINTVKESYEVCIKQFNDVLDKIGLKKIDALNKEFDPNIMEAVMQTPTNEHAPNTVIAELQAGYQLHDRILRPTMVNVATEASEE